MGKPSYYKTKQQDTILKYLIAKKNQHITVNMIAEFLEKQGTPGVTMGHMCMSPKVAAGIFPMSTVGTPGPVIIPPCAVMSVSRAAGLPGMSVHLGFQGVQVELGVGIAAVDVGEEVG